MNFGNASISFYESSKAGDAVAALKASLRPTAVVKRDGQWICISAADVVPGDLVQLNAGTTCPADCRVHGDEIEVDQSALTGESLPVLMYRYDQCKMGSTIVRGETEATVEFTGSRTYFGKTATLLTTNNKMSNLQKCLIRVVTILSVLSAVMCTTAFVYLLVKPEAVPVKQALSFAVVLLVASIPLAMEIVVTTSLALGSKALSAEGAICARLTAIEDLASMDILCSDKTGTLTTNKMELQPEAPVYVPDQDLHSLLQYAAMASKWLEPPRDALDSLILQHVDMSALESVEQLSVIPFDPVLKRTEGTLKDKATGRVFRTTKGAPHVILNLCTAAAHELALPRHQPNQHESELELTRIADIESAQISRSSSTTSMSAEEPNATSPRRHARRGYVTVAQRVEHDVRSLGQRGIRCLACARTVPVPARQVEVPVEEEKEDNDDHWQFLGMLTFLDPPREDTEQTIANAKELGVCVKMITGDHLLIAKQMARRIGLGSHLFNSLGLPVLQEGNKIPAGLAANYGDLIVGADGFAETYPEHKYLIVECLRQMGYKVGMTGDGVNDAPALKVADVGIAVEGATDAAKAAADLVLTKPGLGTIVDGLRISRSIFSRIRNFLTYRISATLQLLFFFFISVFAFKPSDYQRKYQPPGVETYRWPSFFSLPVLLLMLITVLNDGTLISIAYDNASPKLHPEQWNLWALFAVSSVLGAVACLSSILLLYLCLSSWNPSGVFQLTGLGGLHYGQVTTALFLKVAISDFLTLFSARAGEVWIWQSCPSWVLVCAASASLIFSTGLAVGFPLTTIDGIQVLGLGRRSPVLLALYIWLYCLFFLLIQDAAKVLSFYIMRRYNLFNYQYAGHLQKLTQLVQSHQDDASQGDASAPSSKFSSCKTDLSLKNEEHEKHEGHAAIDHVVVHVHEQPLGPDEEKGDQHKGSRSSSNNSSVTSLEGECAEEKQSYDEFISYDEELGGWVDSQQDQ